MPKSSQELSIAELERILGRRRAELTSLTQERDRLQRQLATIDNKIRGLAGQGATSLVNNGGGRAKNATSLIETLLQVLGKSSKPMTVSDILQGVLDGGYRSTSPNFRGIVNQTLIKERKRFANVGRGVYALKKQ
jgi:hypothetical protein